MTADRSDNSIECPECGGAIAEDAPFCAGCGYRRRELVETARELAPVERPPTGDDAPDTLQEIDGAQQRPTVVEGLHAVPRDPGVPPEGASFEAPPSPLRGRLLWITIGLASAAIVAAVALFALEEVPQREAAPVEAAFREARSIEVPGGRFERGLDERTRSFLLTTCRRVAEEPATTCEHDRLFRGEFPETTGESGPFAIGEMEVRVSEYSACVEAGACATPKWRECSVYTQQGLQTALRVPRAFLSATAPQTCVALNEAASYCAWRGGRLPSPDEWEYAARGSDGRLFPWGNRWQPERANWGEADLLRTPVAGALDGAAWVAPPGAFDGASPFGLLDVAGNVGEWTATGEVRGGDYTSTPFELRVTRRLHIDRSERRTTIGFRCAW